MITHSDLLNTLRYEPETGNFIWLLVSPNRPFAITKIAGAVSIGGAGSASIRIRIHGKTYAAHRLAWFYVHARWPAQLIDHINGDPFDNRLVNLREATHAQNQANKRRCKRNSSGYKGVTRCPRTGKWIARIRKVGHLVVLGRYDDLSEAATAYIAAAIAEYGEFARA